MSKTTHKYKIVLTFHHIETCVKEPSYIQIAWKKSNPYPENRSSNTLKPIIILPEVRQANIDDQITLICTIYKRPNGVIYEKSLKISVLADIRDKMQKFGNFSITLKTLDPLVSVFVPIKGTGDKKAQICFSLEAIEMAKQ